MGPIGSAVLTFIGYKQTDRQAKCIYRLIEIIKKIKIRHLGLVGESTDTLINLQDVPSDLTPSDLASSDMLASDNPASDQNRNENLEPRSELLFPELMKVKF